MERKRSKREKEDISSLLKVIPHELKLNIFDRWNPLKLHQSSFFSGVPSHNEIVKSYLKAGWYGQAYRMLDDPKSDKETYYMVIHETPLDKGKPQFGDSNYDKLVHAILKMKQLGFSRDVELFEKLIIGSENSVTIVELYEDMSSHCSNPAKPQVYEKVLKVYVAKDVEKSLQFARSILDKGIKLNVYSLLERLVHDYRIDDAEDIMKAANECDYEAVLIRLLIEEASSYSRAYDIVYKMAKMGSTETKKLLQTFVACVWRQVPKYGFKKRMQSSLEDCFDIVLITGEMPDRETCIPIVIGLQKGGREQEAMFMYVFGVPDAPVSDLKEWVRSTLENLNGPFPLF